MYREDIVTQFNDMCNLQKNLNTSNTLTRNYKCLAFVYSLISYCCF